MTNNELTDERLVKILSETQSTIMDHNSRCVRGSVEVDARLFESMIMELQVRRKTDKPPVHPTVASEQLDDETLQELIDFRRTTFEYHSKEGNKVQTIIHGVTLSALRELQERRKADSEPYGFTDGDRRGMIYKPEYADRLNEPLPVYRHAQPAPVVSAELLHTAASAIEDLLTTKDRTGAFVWFDLPFRLRSAANAQPVTVVPDDVRQALSKMDDEIIAELDAEESACRAAMLEADPQLPGSDSAPVPGSWIPVSERMPERGDYLVTDGCDFDVQLFNGEQFIPGFVWEDKITHWMPLPAAPKEVKGE